MQAGNKSQVCFGKTEKEERKELNWNRPGGMELGKMWLNQRQEKNRAGEKLGGSRAGWGVRLGSGLKSAARMAQNIQQV